MVPIAYPQGQVSIGLAGAASLRLASCPPATRQPPVPLARPALAGPQPARVANGWPSRHQSPRLFDTSPIVRCKRATHVCPTRAARATTVRPPFVSARRTEPPVEPWLYACSSECGGRSSPVLGIEASAGADWAYSIPADAADCAIRTPLRSECHTHLRPLSVRSASWSPSSARARSRSTSCQRPRRRGGNPAGPDAPVGPDAPDATGATDGRRIPERRSASAGRDGAGRRPSCWPPVAISLPASQVTHACYPPSDLGICHRGHLGECRDAVLVAMFCLSPASAGSVQQRPCQCVSL
jgi:hypothetical protein